MRSKGVKRNRDFQSQVPLEKIGVIGGSGVDLLFTRAFKSKMVKTSYGPVKAKQGTVGDKSVIFLERHGVNYNPPHLVNYRANIAALQAEGVKYILATAAVGSLNLKIKPGDLVLLNDFIDFTHNRIEYFNPKEFTDVSFPYNPALCLLIEKVAKKLKIKLHPQAVYVCTEGPRFETKAEIKMYRQLGADVVGMTNVPEVVLAAEAQIPYAVIAVVTNFAAGFSPRKISAEEVVAVMEKKSKVFLTLILEVIKAL